MLIRYVFGLLFLLSFSCSFGQTGPGNLKSYGVSGNTYNFQCEHALFKLNFVSPETFRFRQDDGNADSLMNAPYLDNAGHITVRETRNDIMVTSSVLRVTIHRAPFKLSVSQLQGPVLFQWGKGMRYNKDGSTELGLLRGRDEHFFGLGERMDVLDRQGTLTRLNVGRGKGLPHLVGAYNILEANYSPVPFYMSTEGYGLYLHNAYPSTWDMRSGSVPNLNISMQGGKLDLYFMYGRFFSDILTQYTNITGRSPLLPRFGYGLHVGTYAGGTWGHEASTSDSYVVELARKLRAMGIPADLLWLDSTWRIFGDVGGKGATSFEWRETFKNPKAMFDSIYAMNYKMVGLHLRSRFDNGKKIKLLDTAQKLHYTFPEGNYAGEFVNFFDSASVNFWWQHGVMRTASIGAKFLKTDEGSAFGALANESDKTGPQGADIARLHNLFPIAYAKAPYEKFQQYNGIRGLNQTREGWAGIQRYPYIFAGDWPSEWQYFAPVIRAGLNIGMSGIGHWAHCMGGFEHDADPELYIRWVQFGMLSPVALVFGMDHPGYKEPWNYGEDALRNFRKYDSIRYALLPYIYSTAFQQYQTGVPMMRGLPLVDQNDENTYRTDDEYLFGNDMLICPVTTKGAQSRIVYLPEGNWVNYWSGARATGRQYLNVVSPLDSMPIFVRSGAIIPQQRPMQYVDQRPLDTLVLEVFPGAEREGRLYEDDGQSLAYQRGDYALTAFEGKISGRNYSLVARKIEGSRNTAVKAVQVRMHLAAAPHSVHVNGNELPASAWHYDAVRRMLEYTVSRFEQTNVELSE